MTRITDPVAFREPEFPANAWPEVFHRFFNFQPARGAREWMPSVDVRENPEAYVLTAEVPGLRAEDVKVSVHGDTLTLSGEKSQEERKQGENWYRMERSFGSFQRTFTFPVSMDPSHVEASTKNGLLTITVRKAPQSKPNTIQVKAQ